MTDVNPVVPVSTEPVVPVADPVVPVTPVVTPAPGSQTDPALLLKSLQEEREKRRIAEEALARATAPGADEVFSDEGKVLLNKITQLESVITTKESKELLSTLQTTYPALADKASEFDNFRNDPANAGMKLETAAKAFLAENGLLGTPTRKGLEQPSGGGRTAPPTGQMTPAELDDLRINNYRKYSDMIRKGQIKIGT